MTIKEKDFVCAKEIIEKNHFWKKYRKLKSQIDTVRFLASSEEQILFNPGLRI